MNVMKFFLRKLTFIFSRTCADHLCITNFSQRLKPYLERYSGQMSQQNYELHLKPLARDQYLFLGRVSQQALIPTISQLHLYDPITCHWYVEIISVYLG